MQSEHVQMPFRAVQEGCFPVGLRLRPTRLPSAKADENDALANTLLRDSSQTVACVWRYRNNAETPCCTAFGGNAGISRDDPTNSRSALDRHRFQTVTLHWIDC
jgi:hypothetical protein